MPAYCRGESLIFTIPFTGPLAEYRGNKLIFELLQSPNVDKGGIYVIHNGVTKTLKEIGLQIPISHRFGTHVANGGRI